MANQTDLKNRSRIRIFLPPALFNAVSSAAKENGVTRSFFVVQAIQDGLDGINLAEVEDRLCCRSEAWMPTELKHEVDLLASVSGKPRQSIIRHLIARYLRNIRSKNPAIPHEEDSQ